LNSFVNPKTFDHNKPTRNTKYPISFVLSYNTLSKDYICYTLAMYTYQEPHTYVEASKTSE